MRRLYAWLTITGITIALLACMANNGLGQTASAQEQACPISEPTSPPDAYITNISDVDFHSNQIDKPENSILYKMELSTKIDFNEIFFFSPWMTVPFYTYWFQEDGQYYWQVLTRFDHEPEHLFSVSEPYSLIFDTTPPSVPKLMPEHAIFFENSLTITWLPSSDELCESILYYIEMSESDQFSDITDPIEWREETFSIFKGLENKKEYYFRIKSIDCAGNESSLSDIISLTYDIDTIETAQSDNSPPAPPIIFTPLNNSLSNQINISIKARAEPNTINHIYVNGQLKENVKFMSEIETTVLGIEGENTIEIISQKQSGTQSSSIVKFYID
ncbi:MAG: fibronectin type III domain-containing protein, partial [Patescibacteria group bacterium]|nr:fibronectin type III domain-containing protein [Patescibacteria group bacterium]